jgi:hypothetical protein
MNKNENEFRNEMMIVGYGILCLIIGIFIGIMVSK